MVRAFGVLSIAQDYGNSAVGAGFDFGRY